LHFCCIKVAHTGKAQRRIHIGSIIVSDTTTFFRARTLSNTITLGLLLFFLPICTDFYTPEIRNARVCVSLWYRRTRDCVYDNDMQNVCAGVGVTTAASDTENGRLVTVSLLIQYAVNV